MSQTKVKKWTINGLGIDRLVRRVYPGVEWKHVQDLKQPFTFNVLPVHIRASNSKDCLNCAMALAIKGSVGEPFLPIVSERVTILCNLRSLEVYRGLNQLKLRKEIVRLDTEEVSFAPGFYTILPPTASCQLGVVHPHHGNRPPRPAGDRGKMVRGWDEFVRAADLSGRKVGKNG